MLAERMRVPAWLSVLALVASSIGCKDAAQIVTEKSVSAAKETTKGIAEGIENGRKSGESIDGATIVSSAAELAGKGSVSVYSVSTPDGGTNSEVTLAFENTTDKPLRLTKLDFVIIDKEGFSKKPHGAASELTVPPKAKDKLTFQVDEKAAKLAKVRYWDKDLEIGAEAHK